MERVWENVSSVMKSSGQMQTALWVLCAIIFWSCCVRAIYGEEVDGDGSQRRGSLSGASQDDQSRPPSVTYPDTNHYGAERADKTAVRMSRQDIESKEARDGVLLKKRADEVDEVEEKTWWTPPFSSKLVTGVFVEDGIWCWFSDPRALRYDGDRSQTLVGWVNSNGSIGISALDHITGKVSKYTIHNSLQIDDHNNPALLVRPDGHIMVFYSEHNGKVMFVTTSVKPEGIQGWSKLDTDLKFSQRGLGYTFSYAMPHLLDDGRLILITRGLNYKPNIIISENQGQSWSSTTVMIYALDKSEDKLTRPYIKVSGGNPQRLQGGNTDVLHLAFTDGHPRDVATNSIYYARYRADAFWRNDGSLITTMDALPILPRDADVVYNATYTKVRAWIWDVAENVNGHPVIVYTRLPAPHDHRYHYATWNGHRWLDNEVTKAGHWFPRSPSNVKEREPHYSGGICLDHHDPSIVYLSRRVTGVFEIERWHTADQGATWSSQAITQGSTKDQIRPYAVPSFSASRPPRSHSHMVLWVENDHYSHYTDYRSRIKYAILPDDAS